MFLIFCSTDPTRCCRRCRRRRIQAFMMSNSYNSRNQYFFAVIFNRTMRKNNNRRRMAGRNLRMIMTDDDWESAKQWIESLPPATMLKMSKDNRFDGINTRTMCITSSFYFRSFAHSCQFYYLLFCVPLSLFIFFATKIRSMQLLFAVCQSVFGDSSSPLTDAFSKIEHIFANDIVIN